MSSAASLMAKERRGPRIGLHVMVYPVTDATNFDTPPCHAFENGRWLSRNAMQWLFDAYLPDRERRRELSEIMDTPRAAISHATGMLRRHYDS
jgi:acetyl esterase